jgi:hypothetical protein
MSEPGEGDKPLRLNQDVRKALLDANEGFTDSTYYASKNFTEQRNYEISDGRLIVHSRSKTSWADSRRESDSVADDATTHRFLREHLRSLDTKGVPEAAAAIKTERQAAAAAERKALDRQGATPDASDASSDRISVGENVDDYDYDYDFYDGNRVEDTESSPGAVIAGVVALGTAVWAAPRVKTAWQSKGKPRVEAWRARRSATKASPAEQPSKADGAEQQGHDSRP